MALFSKDPEKEQKKNAEKAFKQGISLYAKKDYDNAIIKLTEAINLDQNHSRAYIIRAESYNAIQQYDQAINDCTEAIKLDPKNFNAYTERGKAYISTGQKAKAVSDMEKAKTLYGKGILSRDFETDLQKAKAMPEPAATPPSPKAAPKPAPKTPPALKAVPKLNAADIVPKTAAALHCKECGAQLEAGVGFCDSCATKQTQTLFCDNCGVSSEPGTPFCEDCGTKLE
jgi:tetratricopeptide (TPR) repeat protein